MLHKLDSDTLHRTSRYCYMPGVLNEGRPLPHEGGKKLPYYCSAYTSFYTTLALAAALHISGVFPLYTIVDEFGSIMTVSIISGFLNSIIVYAQAFVRGRTHRITGYAIYDFFMGAELNPRIGILDFKMFYEVRIPWFILFLITCGVAARQYETYGYVSGEVGFLLMAHFLYTNACAKAEQMIITSWQVAAPIQATLCCVAVLFAPVKNHADIVLCPLSRKTGTCTLRNWALC